MSLPDDAIDSFILGNLRREGPMLPDDVALCVRLDVDADEQDTLRRVDSMVADGRIVVLPSGSLAIAAGDTC